MRCNNGSICSKEGTVVLVRDKNINNGTDFVVSTKAFAAMAMKGKEHHLFKLGILPVQYKRYEKMIENSPVNGYSSNEGLQFWISR